MTENEIHVLFIGDIVGRPGRNTVAEYLNKLRTNQTSYDSDIKSSDMPDFIIANVENASHGFGLTQKNHDEFREMGIHAFTSGNHIWDKKEIFNYIDQSDRLIRPLNYPQDVPGVGSRVFDVNGVSIGVINLLGRVFMTPIDSPWAALEQEVKKIKEITPIIILDFHAEATAEKIAMGHFANSLGVSAVIGTHTHVQTADEKILNNGCAYITDAGFCGSSEGVIGMDIESSIKRLKTSLPEKFDIVSSGNTELNAVKIVIDIKTGKAQHIERIKYYTSF